MEFRRLQWLFPIALTLHNLEEAIWMPSWASAHAAYLPFHPPSAPRTWLALFAFTLAAFATTYLSARRGPQSFWACLLFGYIVAMFVNVFVPHLPAAIFFHEYAPGVVTAVAINLPVMSFLSYRAIREEWVRGSKAVAFGFAFPFLGVAAILAIFGWRLSSQ